MPIFKTICAWCSRVISEEPCTEVMAQIARDNKTDVIISHGMCETCRMRLEKDEFPMEGGQDDV